MLEILLGWRPVRRPPYGLRDVNVIWAGLLYCHDEPIGGTDATREEHIQDGATQRIGGNTVIGVLDGADGGTQHEC